VSYTVAYDFAGFLSPVSNDGVLNVTRAGQTIALKWRLVDANGVPITTLTSAALTTANLTPCDLGTTDNLEGETSGISGLQNLGDGNYQYNWKTPKNYANSCKTMRLDLGEGVVRTALFRFTK
jgi:hypothetical protein